MNKTEVGTALRRSFEADGFAVLPQFVSGEGLAELIANVDRFIEHNIPQLPPEHAFYEDKNDPATLKQIQQMGKYDPWFHELHTRGRLPEIAELLLDGPVIPKNMQYFNKPPNIGQPTPSHQDGYYFMLEPCLAVTMWLALEHVDEENGCLRYAKGSHKRGMREHARTQTLGFSQGIVNYPSDSEVADEIACVAKPGDLLILDAMTIHRADGNRSSTRSRRALGFVYFSQRAREDVAAQAEYQRRLAEQMKSAGKI